MFRGWAVTQNAGSPRVALNNIDLEKFFFCSYLLKYTLKSIQKYNIQANKQKSRKKEKKKIKLNYWMYTAEKHQIILFLNLIWNVSEM